MSIYPAELLVSMRKGKARTTELQIYALLQAHLPGDCSAVYSAEWICSFRGVEKDPIRDPLTEARPAAELYPLGEIDFITIQAHLYACIVNNPKAYLHHPSTER